jgi:hypothetical protein
MRPAVTLERRLRGHEQQHRRCPELQGELLVRALVPGGFEQHAGADPGRVEAADVPCDVGQPREAFWAFETAAAM